MAKISTGNGKLTDLSPEEEKQVISDFARKGEAEAKEGDTFYVLSLRWWRSWSAFVNQIPPITTIDGSSQIISRPPSIDNSNLICESSSTLEIDDTLVEGTDYILVPQDIWNQFYTWYGGGPALGRKVITRGSSQTELTVEVYPLRLQLHFVPTVDHYSIKISRKETIGALHQKACEIFHLTPYQVRIWDYYGHKKHALLNNLNQTLDDANIQMDQEILVEVIAHNGRRHTTAIQQNGSAKNGPFPILESSRKNLSQFQNLSLANKPPPASVGLIGLLNLGNTCFMNSAIQCLVHTPQFACYFLGDFHQEINWQNPLGMKGELALAFGELVRKLRAAGQGQGRAAFSPRAFRLKLARFAPQFGGVSQHDCQEFVAFLLDGLHEDLNRVRQKPYSKSKDADGLTDEQVADEYWANHISRNDSIIVDVFQGQYKSTLICPTCDKISVTFDPFMYLSLPLQPATPNVPPHTPTTIPNTSSTCDEPLSLYTCMDSFLHEEKLLVPEDMWFCPQCKDKRQASKKLDLWKLPEVLVIHLKRFWYSRTMKSKLETFVDFPLRDFDLTKYVSHKNNKNKNNCFSSCEVYELYAVANHYGNMGSGHYTAHVKIINENKWYKFDDSHVSVMSEDDVKSNAAYLLFYRRVKKPDRNGTHSSVLG